MLDQVRESPLRKRNELFSRHPGSKAPDDLSDEEHAEGNPADESATGSLFASARIRTFVSTDRQPPVMTPPVSAAEPSARSHERLASNIDRPEEDEVVLAPVRAFSPGGSSKDDGKEADIVSPFAKQGGTSPKQTRSRERGQEEIDLASLDPANSKGSDPEKPVITPFPVNDQPKRPQRLPERDAGLSLDAKREPVSALAPESDARDKVPPFEEITPAVSPTVMPAEAASSVSGGRTDGLGHPRPEPSTEQEPLRPETRSRWRATLAVSAKGLRVTAGGLSSLWDVYSRHCAAFEVVFLSFARHALVHGRRLSGAIGVALVKASLMAVSIAGRLFEKSKPGLVAFAKAVFAASQSMATLIGRKIGLAAVLIKHFVVSASRSITSKAKRESALENSSRAAALIDRLRGSMEKRPTPKDLEARGQESEGLESIRSILTELTKTTSTTSGSPLSGETAAMGEESTADAGLKSDASSPETANPLARGSDDLAVEPQASFWQPIVQALDILPRPRIVVAGFAAASIIFLMMAISTLLSEGPARAELLVALPDRPSDQATIASIDTAIQETPGRENKQETDVALLEDRGPQLGESRGLNDDSGVYGKSYAGVLPPLLIDEEGPLADIVAFVERRSKIGAATVEDAPLLTVVEGIEGLERFAEAAALVGLEKLLQDNQRYTIFAPSNAAFEALEAGDLERLLDPSGHDRLLTLLTHHVLQRDVRSHDLDSDQVAQATIANGLVTIDPATIIKADVTAENGVLHIVDRMLTIPSP